MATSEQPASIEAMTVIDFTKDNERRLKRMETWIDLAKDPKWAKDTEGYDPHAHVRFVFYWIAYEAAFEGQKWDPRENSPLFHEFYKRLAERGKPRLRECLRGQEACIRNLFGLRQASRFFWYKEGQDLPKDAKDWEDRFTKRVEEQREKLQKAVYEAGSAVAVLDDVFKILSLVRNQIIHGGSSGSSSQGRSQVRWGAQLLCAFVPCFFNIIEEHKGEDWGKPPFPRVGWKPDDPEARPPWLE